MEKIVSSTLNLTLFCKSDIYIYTINRDFYALVKTFCYWTLG